MARQKAIENDELTALEMGQLRRFHDQRWRHYERVYYLHEYGVISEQEWVGYKNGIKRAFEGTSTYWEISRSQWNGGKALFSQRYVEYVDALVQPTN